MTKKAHREERKRDRANLKQGFDHPLDEKTDADLGRDESGHVRKGLAGVSHPLDSVYLGVWLAEIDWQIGHADLPMEALPDPAKNLDLELACRLAGLTGLQQEAMLMRLEGHSLGVIADLLQVEKASVQHRLNWGRLKLKAAFGDLGLDMATG